MNANVLAWLRSFLSAAFGGAADGVIIGLSGTGYVSMGSGAAANPHTVVVLMTINTLLDTARFVKANKDPWAFPIAVPPPPVVVQISGPASGAAAA